MAFVRVEQLNVRPLSAVKVELAKGSDGEIAKGTVTTIKHPPRART